MADELKFAGKNTLLYLWQKIKATFVSKETGKGLSTNDYTTAEKEKLAGIAAGAQVNQDISGKANLASPAFTGNPTAPTPATGSNNTAIATTEFVNGAITSALGNITGIRFEIIQDLSGDGETGVIYLLEASNGNITGNAGNYFDEYIWLEDDSRYEKIGTTDVDLSGYVASSDISEISNAEVDTLIATASS